MALTEAQKQQKSDEALEQKKAHYRASSRLREFHRDEFEKLMEEECRAMEIPYARTLTPVEKAANEIEEILARFPELREEFSAS